MQATVGVLFIAYLAICYANISSHATIKDDCGFIFTVPKSVRSGRRETACLSLHNSKPADGRINVTVSIDTTLPHKATSVTTKIFDTENVGCFEIKVPDTTDLKAKIHLQIKYLDESNYSINSVDEINIVQNKVVTFVQTDREIYKPGDRVKIRILILTHDLTVPKNLVIPIVKIRNPIRIAIGQWENVTTELGLVQLEHQLSQDTMLGTWIIELPENNYTFKTFLVKEYMLPRFGVTIEHPQTVYSHSSTFNFTVCAKYAYGAAVKGTAHMKIEILYEHLTVNQIKELRNGCHKFIFERSEIPITQYRTLSLEITATVTEQGTGQLESSTSSVQVSGEKFVIHFNNPTYFQPGIPYKGQVQVRESFEDLTNKTMKICYNLAVNMRWNLTTEKCGHFKLNENNSVYFVILPFEDNIHSISIKANIEEEYENIHQQVIYFTAMKWFSPSNSYIHIYRNGSGVPVKCKSWQQFIVVYTFNNTLDNVSTNEPILFNYLIKSKGHILKFGKVAHTFNNLQKFRMEDYKNILGYTTNVKPKLFMDKFILTIKIHQKMFSEGQLLVYYVRKDGEVVGANVDIQVEKCLLNKVESTWSDNQNYPGEPINLRIKAAAGSLCAISAVDKTTTLLSQPSRFNVEDLLKSVQKPAIFDFVTRNKCRSDIPINFDAMDSIPYWDLRRRKRFFEDGLEYYDTLQVFYDNDILVMTDLKIVTRPCPDMQHHGARVHNLIDNRVYYNSPAPYQTQVTDMGASVRSYFPETWLWELVPIGRSGETQVKRELPHSITQWVGNTLCISPSAGIGISKTNNVTAFKHFFIDVLTPFSVKRNEVSHIKVIAFNYLNHSLPIRITLEVNTDIRLAGPPEESSITACVGPHDSVTNTFRIIALLLGQVNIIITAEVDAAYPGECGPEILINRKDVVLKSILVQLEGFPFEAMKSTFVCVNENANDTNKEIRWNMELPHDAVKNSSKIKVLLDADLLELTIQNLGDLVKMPTGCGEQIMSTLAPNLYILNYLKLTGNLTPELNKKILNYIKIGYERILQYRHQDGSFSAFGERFGNGSMFLTAFVLRTLSHASQHVYIDENILKSATLWIIEKQLENGCFPVLSHVFQTGVAENTDGNTALTAYVLISLLESRLPIPEKVRDNAKFCLRGHNSLNKYAMAVTTYALTLVNWTSEAERSLSRMIDVASRHNNLMWWEDPESTSNTLEMTSYVIMSLINTNNSENIAIAAGAIRWLLTKRNAYGGFISTQDTVVALDALTKYALIAKKDDNNLTILISTTGKQYAYKIRNKAKLKTKQITLTKFSNFINFNVNGHGCILLQCILRYNMPQIISSEAFKVAVAVSPVSTTDKCSVAELLPCLSYKTPDKHANMAVLEITLPSGYKGDRTSLYQLIKNQKSRVKRFEEVDDKVILYFTELSNEQICVPFLINEHTIIENRIEAIVKLYDYYNPEISAFTSYELPTCLPNIITNISTDSDVLDTNKSNVDGVVNIKRRSTRLDDLSNYQQDDNYDIRNGNYIIDGVNLQSRTGINPSFVDLDIDLAFPDGIEGPVPSYVKPPSNIENKNHDRLS